MQDRDVSNIAEHNLSTGGLLKHLLGSKSRTIPRIVDK